MKPNCELKLFAALLVVLLLAACGGPDTGPTDALNESIEHLKAGELEEFSEHLTADADFDLDDVGLMESQDLLRAMVHHLEVEVLEQEIDGDQAVLRVRGQNAMGSRIMRDMMSFGNLLLYGMMGDDGEEMMQRDMIERFRADDAPTRTEETTVELRKVSNEWLLVAPDMDTDTPPMFWQLVFAFIFDV